MARNKKIHELLNKLNIKRVKNKKTIDKGKITFHQSPLIDHI